MVKKDINCFQINKFLVSLYNSSAKKSNPVPLSFRKRLTRRDVSAVRSRQQEYQQQQQLAVLLSGQKARINFSALKLGISQPLDPCDMYRGTDRVTEKQIRLNDSAQHYAKNQLPGNASVDCDQKHRYRGLKYIWQWRLPMM